MQENISLEISKEPSNDEIEHSVLIKQLQNSYDVFNQVKNTPDVQSKFENLVENYEKFLDEETNTKLIHYYSPALIEKIIDDLEGINFNPNLFINLFKMLNKTTSLTYILDSRN